MSNYTAPSYEEVLKQCRGRKGLRTSKPKDSGFSAYVWRMARFHSGLDIHLPMMAEFDLANWADHSYVSGDHQAYRNLKKQADQMVDRVCQDLGLSNLEAAHRWARAYGYY